ncbi:MAG: hypothetical protein HOH20_15200 [Rhodospirillaceae bacterium]|jgi:hypothetical protein|nr:hypothetical protein [Rhodospirillaceae bacterium]MBT5240967.1 hypothetical protein [Rhodospirillaceae bacterium]MBT5564583.1 hypothetical protein [Rhodospirillaceae bacterium]MBT6090918.1 hypothetical protein [Rhodospirillaceae bacterium]
MSEEKASILVMKAAGEVRRAAELDKNRAIELTSVADYLESMVFEDELDKGALESESKIADSKQSQVSEIEKLVTPFKVRLTR